MNKVDNEHDQKEKSLMNNTISTFIIFSNKFTY